MERGASAVLSWGPSAELPATEQAHGQVTRDGTASRKHVLLLRTWPRKV